MLDQINEVFFEEANELLESLEGYLLSLEENPSDRPAVVARVRSGADRSCVPLPGPDPQKGK